MNRGQKILVGLAGGLIAVAASPFIPAVAVAGVSLKLAIGFLGTFLGGWATRTPGHVKLEDGEGK